MSKQQLKFLSLVALLSLAALAAPQRAAADDDDPPGRIARLSRAEGSVSFEPAGTDDWVDVVVNRPITTGDKLWADKSSRAELQMGSASIRMGSNTGFSFLDLNDNVTQLQLTEGTLRIRVKRLERDETFEVDTPNLAFNIERPGIYRININEAGDTTIVEVRNGGGQVTGGGQTFDVREGESGRFYGTDELSGDIEGLEGDDDFDNWCDERDRDEDHSISRRYVSDDAVGYTDLDDYGGWRDTPEYGTVWFPHTTVVGWAPYRYGHWVYIYPWGYTWVDDEPWGFAPFHYGRWVVVGSVWGWVPCRPAVVGVAYVRPVYAPALVAWVGGPHFAIGVGVGGAATVGWFPLGPREVYVPPYRVSRTYVNNVNITNTTVNTTVVNNYYNTTIVNKTTVNNITYVNQRVPGAVTAAPARVVASAEPVSRNIVRVDEREIARAPVAVQAPGVAPERQAVLGAGRQATVRPPAQVVTRQVVARTAPPPPPPRFETQQNLIKQNGGRPPEIAQARQAEARENKPAPPVRIAPAARPGNPQNAENRQGQPQVNREEANRPGNSPQNNERPANERVNNAPQNVQSNRPPSNVPQNNERPVNERLNNPQTPQSVQPNRPTNAPQPANPPANNQRQFNDRPPSARPSNAQPANNPPTQYRNAQQLEQQHQQELENMHKQQDQQRQQLEQKQRQEQQQLAQQRADQQRQQQLQQQHQQQLQEMYQQHQQQQQQVQQRQQQEHQQQRQQERPQGRPQPQERSKPAEKSQGKPGKP